MFRTIILGAAAAAAFCVPAFADIVVSDAYARSANQKTAAAFMALRNTGEADAVVVAARADDMARKVELHTHLFENGVARMREVEGGIPVPAGETVLLQRGGLHVMFMGLNRRMEQGDRFPLTLVMQSGAEVQVDVVVDHKRMQPNAMGHGGHGKGHGQMKGHTEGMKMGQ